MLDCDTIMQNLHDIRKLRTFNIYLATVHFAMIITEHGTRFDYEIII